MENGKRRGNGDGWLSLGATGPAIHALEKRRAEGQPPAANIILPSIGLRTASQDDETTFDGAQGRVMTARAYHCGHVKGDIKQRTTD